MSLPTSNCTSLISVFNLIFCMYLRDSYVGSLVSYHWVSLHLVCVSFGCVY